MIDENYINDMRRKISILEWDLQMISNKEIKKIKEKTLNSNRLELNRLLNFRNNNGGENA